MPIVSLPFNNVLEILAGTSRHEKPISDIRIGKVKLSLFADDIIMDLGSPKKSMAKPNKIIRDSMGFPGGTVVKNPPANAGDTDSSRGLGRSHMLRSN